jgi:NAD(P)-dependent dehydrogenase (short-subunit alcohol dehydrogenase family)
MIEEQGGRALAVRCDVTRTEDVKAALAKTIGGGMGVRLCQRTQSKPTK